MIVSQDTLKSQSESAAFISGASEETVSDAGAMKPFPLPNTFSTQVVSLKVPAVGGGVGLML